MYEVKVSSWAQAKSIVEREVEERLKGKIKSSWVESIWLTPHSEGSKWMVKLRVLVKMGFIKNRGYIVHAVLNSFTGEIEEFEVRESSKK